MNMDVFGDKERVREVYGFAKDDPDFENFYNGVSLIAQGRSFAGLTELRKSRGCKNFTPFYRYAMAAMIDVGVAPPEVVSLVLEWEMVAKGSPNPEDLEVVKSAKGFVRKHYDKEMWGRLLDEA